jgi:excisionase family DNA binding protein
MQVYTVKEIAEMLKVSPRTVERLIEQDHLRAMHVGRRLRITQESLEAYAALSEGRGRHPTGTSP